MLKDEFQKLSSRDQFGVLKSKFLEFFEFFTFSSEKAQEDFVNYLDSLGVKEIELSQDIFFYG